jgi:hypothetical protein
MDLGKLIVFKGLVAWDLGVLFAKMENKPDADLFRTYLDLIYGMQRWALSIKLSINR